MAALLREIRKTRSIVQAGDVVSEEISRTKSLCQGGPDAPKLFNLIFDRDLEGFDKECQWKQ